MLNGVIDRIVGDITSEGHLENLTEQKAVEIFLKTPLGDVAKKLQMYPSLAAALVSSDPNDSIEIVSNKHGFHPLVIHAIIAIIKKDLQ